MGSKVLVKFDLLEEPGASQLSIDAGGVLTVASIGGGDGWWEGRNSLGAVGPFPAEYVEVITSIETRDMSQSPAHSGVFYELSDEETTDDDEEEETLVRHPGAIALPPALESAGNSLKKSGSCFKRSEAYIVGRQEIKDDISDIERSTIAYTDSSIHWVPRNCLYTVIVASPKKERKLKGFKKFVAYPLTPTFNYISIFRRYKHFDWLCKRLQIKFPLIAIPPLPEKQISCRFEEQFIEHRRVQLQEFVDWICRHPVLSQCKVWQHFLTCTDKVLWKLGKRKMEQDVFVGLNYCMAISPPEKNLSKDLVDLEIEKFSEFINAMQSAIRNLHAVTNFETERCKNRQMEYQTIGDCLSQLSKALSIDERRASSTVGVSLSAKVSIIGDIYTDVGKIFAEQPKRDWTPFLDRLYVHRGILSNFRGVLTNHSAAMRTRKKYEHLCDEQKLPADQFKEVIRRTDVISYAVMAEMNHFKEERESHLMDTLMSLINEQIKFHLNVALRLQEAQRQFGKRSTMERAAVRRNDLNII